MIDHSCAPQVSYSIPGISRFCKFCSPILNGCVLSCHFRSSSAQLLKSPWSSLAGSETGSNKGGSASAEDGYPGISSEDKSGAMIGISIAAGGILACVVILAFCCWRRELVGDDGNDAMKPDTADVSTLDTSPMHLSEVSFRVQKNGVKDDLATEPFAPESTFERGGNFIEVNLNEI